MFIYVLASIESHVHDLHMQYEKMQPDSSVVKDRMQRTFAWRRKEIMDGLKVEDVLRKNPFLRTPSRVSDTKPCHLEHFNCISLLL